MIDQNANDSKFTAFVNEYRQEIKFVLIFGISLFLGFKLIYNDYVANNIIIKITEFETMIASKILNLIGYDNVQDGLYVSGANGNPWRMQVLNTCNGVYESMIFLVAFVAIQVPWRRKIGWMLIGFFFFHCVNELRLVSLFIVGSNYSHETFVFFHETFWNYAIVIVALLSFIFCAHQVSKSPEIKEEPATES